MPARTAHRPGTISWTDLATSDLDAAKAFYGRVFGWEFHDAPMPGGDPYAMVQRDGRAVCAAFTARPEMGPPHWNLYVTVESADEAAERSRQAGGTVVAEPFDVMDAGRMTLVQDPGGAHIAFWESRSSIGAEMVNEPGAMTWADLNTRDPQAAQRFYAEMFGWEYEQMSQSPAYWVIRNGDRSNGGMMGMDDAFPPEVPSHWIPYFGHEDLDAAIAAAQEAGGRKVGGPMEIPENGRIAVFMDPQGAGFCIFEGEYDPD